MIYMWWIRLYGKWDTSFDSKYENRKISLKIQEMLFVSFFGFRYVHFNRTEATMDRSYKLHPNVTKWEWCLEIFINIGNEPLVSLCYLFVITIQFLWHQCWSKTFWGLCSTNVERYACVWSMHWFFCQELSFTSVEVVKCIVSGKNYHELTENDSLSFVQIHHSHFWEMKHNKQAVTVKFDDWLVINLNVKIFTFIHSVDRCQEIRYSTCLLQLQKMTVLKIPKVEEMGGYDDVNLVVNDTQVWELV